MLGLGRRAPPPLYCRPAQTLPSSSLLPGQSSGPCCTLGPAWGGERGRGAHRPLAALVVPRLRVGTGETQPEGLRPRTGPDGTPCPNLDSVQSLKEAAGEELGMGAGGPCPCPEAPGPWTPPPAQHACSLGVTAAEASTRKSGLPPRAPTTPSSAHRERPAGPGGGVIRGGMEHKIQGPMVHRISLSGGRSRGEMPAPTHKGQRRGRKPRARSAGPGEPVRPPHTLPRPTHLLLLPLPFGPVLLELLGLLLLGKAHRLLREKVLKALKATIFFFWKSQKGRSYTTSSLRETPRATEQEAGPVETASSSAASPARSQPLGLPSPAHGGSPDQSLTQPLPAPRPREPKPSPVGLCHHLTWGPVLPSLISRTECCHHQASTALPVRQGSGNNALSPSEQL